MAASGHGCWMSHLPEVALANANQQLHTAQQHGQNHNGLGAAMLEDGGRCEDDDWGPQRSVGKVYTKTINHKHVYA